MNSYLFGFLVEPTTPPVAGDAATLGTLCNAIGNLLFGPPVTGKDGKLKTPVVTIGGRLGITTGGYVSTNAAAANAAVEIVIDSPYRLDQDLMPATMGATTSGTITYSAGAGICGVTLALDNECGTIVYDVDRPVVTEGCGIVAYAPAGVSLSSQLSSMVSIPVCNGQNLIIGRANQTAVQGVYDDPFSTAWAFGIFGGNPVQDVAVVAVAQNTVRSGARKF